MAPSHAASWNCSFSVSVVIQRQLLTGSANLGDPTVMIAMTAVAAVRQAFGITFPENRWFIIHSFVCAVEKRVTLDESSFSVFTVCLSVYGNTLHRGDRYDRDLLGVARIGLRCALKIPRTAAAVGLLFIQYRTCRYYRTPSCDKSRGPNEFTRFPYGYRRNIARGCDNGV